MLQDKTLTFTKDELCDASEGNLVSLILVATQYFQQNSMDPGAFWRYVGQRFTPGWSDVEYGDIHEVARRIARNLASCAATVEAFRIDNEQAELVFSNWPPAPLAEFFAISETNAAAVCEVFRPIVSSIGLLYEWELADGLITIHIEA